jgi:hypothetical protein
LNRVRVTEEESREGVEEGQEREVKRDQGKEEKGG